MATIVEHRELGTRFLLLGAGYGAHRSERGMPFVRGAAEDVDAGFHPMVCVCGDDGRIGFMRAEKLVVVSVDGRPVGEVLER